MLLVVIVVLVAIGFGNFQFKAKTSGDLQEEAAAAAARAQVRSVNVTAAAVIRQTEVAQYNERLSVEATRQGEAIRATATHSALQTADARVYSTQVAAGATAEVVRATKQVEADLATFESGRATKTAVAIMQTVTAVPIQATQQALESQRRWETVYTRRYNAGLGFLSFLIVTIGAVCARVLWVLNKRFQGIIDEQRALRKSLAQVARGLTQIRTDVVEE